MKKRLYEYPKIIITIVTLITLFLAMQIPKLVTDNDIEIFIPEQSEARILNDKTEATFGSSDMIAVALKVNQGDVFTKDNLALIDKLTNEFEELEGITDVKSLVNSDYIDGDEYGMSVAPLIDDMNNQDEIDNLKKKIISWRDMYGKSLVSNDFKSTQLLLTVDENYDAKEKETVYKGVEEIVESNKGHQGTFYTAGHTVINVLMGEFMQKDVKTLIPFVLLTVLVSLYLSFHRLGGVILPTLTVLISTIWTMGTMALLHIKITMVATAIPVLLIAVGSAYGIHIISHFYDEINHHDGEVTAEDYRRHLNSTLKHVGKPVLLAGITTVIGFVSLATSEIVPIKEFGIFTGIGVVSALVIALTLIPVLLNMKKVKKKLDEDESPLMNKLIMAIYHEMKGNRMMIIVTLSLIIVISIVGIRKIVIDNVMIDYFKPTTAIVKADEFENKEFSGTNILNVVIDGTEAGKGSLTNPDVLKQMDEMKNHFMTSYDYIGNITSFTDFIKRMNKVMNYPQEEAEKVEAATDDSGATYDDGFGDDSFGDDSFGDDSFGDDEFAFEGDTFDDSFGGDEAVAATSTENTEVAVVEKVKTKDPIELINNALANSDDLDINVADLINLINKERNYEGEAYNEIPTDLAKYGANSKEELKNLISQYLLLYSGSLDDYVDDQLEPTQARMVFQLKSASNIVTKEFKENINNYVENNFPEGYKVTVSGAGDLSLATNNLIVGSQIKSVIFSLIAVFVIVAISYKSPIAGIFGIIPLGISLLINFGIMGFAGVKLDIATSMVASIAIGIGVDYTIHFLSAYNEERKKTDDIETVNMNTLTSTGKAIIFNAISVALGFLVLVFSNFEPLVSLGILVAITMFTSSMAALVVLPVLLAIFKPKFIRK